ncbi:MAG: hypothetical protein ACK559_14000, partial [bacterium]
MPAPELGALGAPVHELLVDEVPLHLVELVVQRPAAGGLAPGVQAPPGLVEEGCLAEGVVRAVAHRLHGVHALLDLAVGVPV